MEKMHMLDLDGSTKFLVVNSRAVKTMSQDASGGSFLTGLDHLSVYRLSNVSFPFVFIPCFKEPFCMGSNMEKEFISFPCSSFFSYSPLILEETSLCSGSSFKYSSPPQKRLVDGVHESYDEDLGPLML